MNERIQKKIFALSDLGFVLAGVFFMVLSILFLRAPQTHTAVGQAVITNIFSEYDQINETTVYDVRVAYSVDGMRFTDMPYGHYHTGMKVGDEVEIRYNPVDPSDFAAPGADKVPYVTLAAGAAVTVFGAFRLLRRRNGLASDTASEEAAPWEYDKDTNGKTGV